MANIKFSQFTVETAKADVDFLVGYSGPDNVQISPTNLLADYPAGSGAAGQVTFFSAASTVTGDNDLYWDNTNKRLGVGTTSPDRKFEIESTGAGEMCITGTTDSRLFFRPTSSYSPGGNFGILVSGGSAPSYLSTMSFTGYGSGVNTVMTLKGDGDVGIGTVSPSAKLHVNGTLISTGISQLGSGGSNVLLTSSSAGNVGIGTTSPSEKLEISGGKVKIDQPNEALIIDASANQGSYIVLSNAGTDYAFIGAANQIITAGTNTQLGLRSQSDMLFSTNGITEKMRIDTSGNVGIGTAEPKARLHISGSDSTLSAIRQSRVGTVIWDQAIDSSGRLQWGTRATEAGSRTVRFTLDDNGYVGIGTGSPNSNLEIDGDSGNAFIQLTTPNTNYAGIRFGDPQSINAGRIQYYHGAGALEFDTEVRFVFQGGNVGIGTDSPASKLEVDGGDIEVDDSASGLILRSPDGTRYRVTVANGGTLSVSAV